MNRSESDLKTRSNCKAGNELEELRPHHKPTLRILSYRNHPQPRGQTQLIARDHDPMRIFQLHPFRCVKPDPMQRKIRHHHLLLRRRDPAPRDIAQPRRHATVLPRASAAIHLVWNNRPGLIECLVCHGISHRPENAPTEVPTHSLLAKLLFEKTNPPFILNVLIKWTYV